MPLKGEAFLDYQRQRHQLARSCGVCGKSGNTTESHKVRGAVEIRCCPDCLAILTMTVEQDGGAADSFDCLICCINQASPIETRQWVADQRAERNRMESVPCVGFNICLDCDAVVSGLRAAMRNDNEKLGKAIGKALANALGTLNRLLEEEPDKYCADCLASGQNHVLMPYESWRRQYPNECVFCFQEIFETSRIPLAQLPPGVTAPGEVQGVMVRISSG